MNIKSLNTRFIEGSSTCAVKSARSSVAPSGGQRNYTNTDRNGFNNLYWSPAPLRSVDRAEMLAGDVTVKYTH